MDFDVSEGTTIRLDRFDGEGHVDLTRMKLERVQN